MTVSDLIAKLKELAPGLIVYVKDEGDFVPVNAIYEDEITDDFSETIDPVAIIQLAP